MYEYGNLIQGKWVAGKGDAFTTLNPARPSDVVGRYTGASIEQVHEAVTAAVTAQRKWRSVSAPQRVAVVEAFITALLERTEDLALSITREQGKPIAESRGEVGKSCAEARVMVGEALRVHGTTLPSARPGIRNMVTRRARGVIAAITPWNFPILTPMRKLLPAIALGNAVIIKPSEFTPATTCLIGEVATATLPPGLLQVLNGDGRIGGEMVRTPGIAGVTFTGSVATSQRIYADAAGNLAEISLELGGKNAVVINDTADIESCLNQVMAAAFMCAGQRCTAISRVLVQRKLHDAVVDGLAARCKAAVLGDGMDAATTMGPLVNAKQFARVGEMVQACIKEGARLVCGGAVAKVAGLEKGYFYQPTVLADVTKDMSAAREEIFGPVISVLVYDTEDEAFDMLNGVAFGLTSSLFSDRSDLVQRFIEESENGMIHINHGTIPDNHMPFGGVKNSGVGAYSVGPSVVNFFTTEHSVYIK